MMSFLGIYLKFSFNVLYWFRASFDSFSKWTYFTKAFAWSCSGWENAEVLLATK